MEGSAQALGDLRAGRKVLLKVHGTAEHHETVVMSGIEFREAHADAPYPAVLRYLLQEHVFLFIGYGMNAKSSPLPVLTYVGVERVSVGAHARGGWR